MAYFTTLYSGSSGNCALIRSEDKYLLISAQLPEEPEYRVVKYAIRLS